MKTSAPLVAIECLAYNHGPYIRQCLDGFVMQKTDFPFIAIVHDDASTDDTAKIIREYAQNYPDIIKPILETENQYSKKDGALRKAIDRAMPKDAKYIAMCEGDDYWTDPYKLQKQVHILEQQKEYDLVYSHYKILYDKNNRLVCASMRNRPKGDVFKSLLLDNFITTNTVLIRYEAYVKAIANISSYSRSWLMGDYPLWLEVAKMGKFWYLPDVTTVYRVRNESASHSDDFRKILKFNESAKEVQLFYATKSGLKSFIPAIETMFNSRMYQYCLEYNYSNIRPFRSYFLNLKECTTLKTKLFKCCATSKVLEGILKALVNNIFARKLYSRMFRTYS